MNDLGTIGMNALTLLIVFGLFYIIYLKIRKQEMHESWDEIKMWVGGKTK